MMDVTTREFRYLLRKQTRHTTLYTEMIPAEAIVHGRSAELLSYDEPGPPVLQLGSADPEKMAAAGERAREAGYTTVNINAGCPSPRVRSGGFGVFLMGQKDMAAEMVKRLKARNLTVTVKHRLGVDCYDPTALLEFCRTLIHAGVDALIVHARIALSRGISPEENRTIPPLDYDAVYRLKDSFPDLPIVINGGIAGKEAIMAHLERVDGVMIGRAVARNPAIVSAYDRDFFGDPAPPSDFWDGTGEYLRQRHLAGRPPGILCRAIMDWMHGRPGGKLFRQILSESKVPFLERWEQAEALARTSTDQDRYSNLWSDVKQRVTLNGGGTHD
ncbi:MAG: tRNA dihydrouridine(20/20a) synthase DusA [Spirochaetales bacterium]|nr:tRNA dihydrouridine(20/20a) synthase DusA [Spirochaetales bacterium]